MSQSLSKLLTGSAAIVALVSACGADIQSAAPAETSGPSSAAEPAAVASETETESARLNAWFEEKFEQQVMRSPTFQTFLGRKTNYDKWNDESDARAIEDHALRMAALEEMRTSFDFDALDDSTKLSYRLFEYGAERGDTSFPWRNHWYEFSHFRGPHSGTPPFMINQHRVSSVEDAEAYISRLYGFKTKFAQHQENAEAQYEKGIYPPKWSFARMIDTVSYTHLTLPTIYSV